MNALLLITAFLATVTIREIVQAVAEHVKAKDAIKALETVKETQEAKSREAEYQLSVEKTKENTEKLKKQTAEMEKIAAETKIKLAQMIEDMTPEQLSELNRTLDNYNKPTAQYVPVPVPVPVPPWALFNQQQGITQWRGW